MAMKFVPRVITDGSAVALGGYIHRVNDKIIRRNLQVPSASTSFGGMSDLKPGPFAFAPDDGDDKVVSFGDADVKTWHQREDGNGKGPIQTVHSKSSISDLSIGGRLFLTRASAYLKSVYQDGDSQPTITPVEASIEGLVIDGVRFNVKIGAETVTNLATCHQFHHAAEHDKHFKATQGSRLLSLWDAADGRTAKGCFVYSLVERIEWDGKLPKGADVSEDSNVIVWPDFGKVVLGEMLISHFNRRMTMMRLELGSPLEASVEAIDVQTSTQDLP
jgi:hypothetical protein